MSNSILFVDIETAPEYRTFAEMPEDGKAAFAKKFKSRIECGDYMDLEEAYQGEAALYAEFSKIICIGIGSVVLDKNDSSKIKIFLKGYTGDEKDILTGFLSSLEKGSYQNICAHRGKQFDFPFIARRLQIKGIALPQILAVQYAKPWELNWEDTAELWQFTDKKHYVSLITLAYVFGIPSPKTTLDGSQVPAAFYEGRIDDIKKYCLDDVLCLVRIWRKMKYEVEITDIIIV